MFRLKSLLSGLKKRTKNIIGITKEGGKTKKTGDKKRKERDDRYIENIMNNILQRNSNCIDVGAYKGEYLERFTKYCPEGRHIAFEPMPKYANKLIKEFKGIKVHNCALSNEKGEREFYKVIGREAWSGLKKQNEVTEKGVDKLVVEVNKMDNELESGHKVDFIKIDVEGAEYKVLEGSERIINNNNPIVLFEHAKIHSKNYNYDSESLYNLLRNRLSMHIHKLDMKKELSKREFIDIINKSYESNYCVNSQTNFIAKKKD
jgi:FkbM family methyltransferase